MSLKARLMGGGKVEALRERSLELEQALGERPTVDDLQPLRLVLEELCEAGYWPAHKSLALLHGKMIWITLDRESASSTRRRRTRRARSGAMPLWGCCSSRSTATGEARRSTRTWPPTWRATGRSSTSTTPGG
jgi:hypothetical protein